MEKHLHIISLNIPYPADYGGVYDIFYKLPALKQQGVKIHLHCFYKDRKPQTELNKYCEEVFYYPRKMGLQGISFQLPFIVSSRNNETLHERLLKDNHPVFMEGVHCSSITNDARFNNRKKFIRIVNVEHEYYNNLAKFSSSITNKLYYEAETFLLKKYEKQLAKQATAYWALTPKDAEFYRNNYNCSTMDYLPVFLPHWTIKNNTGRGTYCLYHANLEVEENEFTALWLIQNVFSKLNIPFIVAGKNPSKKIYSKANAFKHINIVANPHETQMQDMIEKAHIHVLPSFTETGIKFKLLNALFNGRHCIANNNMLAGTALKQTCIIANSADEFIHQITGVYNIDFSDEDVQLRRQCLQHEFSNEEGARQMVKWIWETYA